MKKGLKKEIERELQEVIHKTLFTHNMHAVSKARKVIKDASKSVAKKFVKTLKNIDAKEKPRKAKGKSKGKSKKASSAHKVNHKKIAAKTPAKTNHKAGKNHSMPNGMKAKTGAVMNSQGQN